MEQASNLHETNKDIIYITYLRSYYRQPLLLTLDLFLGGLHI